MRSKVHFLKDPCGGRVRQGSVQGKQRDQTHQDDVPQCTSLIFTKKHPSGLECSMHSLPDRRSSWQTESGLFDDYGINQRELWNCSDLFTLFKNLCLIMQVMFEYILVIKNSNGTNQVKVPLIEFTLSHVPPIGLSAFCLGHTLPPLPIIP